MLSLLTSLTINIDSISNPLEGNRCVSRSNGFTATHQEQFDAHMKIHYDHTCPLCGYPSKTEGRLRCHIKKFHSPGAAEPATPSKKSSKKSQCRYCDFNCDFKVRVGRIRSSSAFSVDDKSRCPAVKSVNEFNICVLICELIIEIIFIRP